VRDRRAVPIRRPLALPELFLGLLSLAIAAVWIAHVFAATIHDARHTHDTLSVTASARVPIASNLVQWSLDVDGSGATQAAAAHALRREVTEVLKFLAASRIPQAVIAPQVVETNVVVTRVNKHLTKTTYHVSEEIQVGTRQLDLVQAAATRVGGLLEQGVGVSAQPLAFISTDLEQAKLNALVAATAEAHRRAEIIVKGLGGKLGPMRASSLGVYQITPRNSTEVSDYGYSDTTSRLKDVTAVVNATFAVER
jgi:hypothetical protein